MENPFNELTTFVYVAKSAGSGPPWRPRRGLANDVGRPITQQNHNGTWVSHTYDDAGRLSQLVNLKSDNSTLSSFAYSLDNVGNRIGVTEASGDVVTWSYDDAYQLTREQRDGTNAYDITYSYDAVGNRLTKEESGATTTYSYDAANQIETEETAAQVTTYTFDDNGNTSVVNAGGDLTTYSWNIENLMTEVALPDASTATFTYDGDKRRRSKTEGGTATNFIREGERVLLEMDSGGTTQAQYTVRGPGWFDSLVAMRRSGASSFYHFDALGSTDRLTDAAEDISDSYTYKAFGQIAASSGTTENPFRYVGNAGYYRDPQISLLQLGIRMLNTSLGRFLSQDTLIKINRQNYAANNPANRIDPGGKHDLKPGDDFNAPQKAGGKVVVVDFLKNLPKEDTLVAQGLCLVHKLFPLFPDFELPMDRTYVADWPNKRTMGLTYDHALLKWSEHYHVYLASHLFDLPEDCFEYQIQFAQIGITALHEGMHYWDLNLTEEQVEKYVDFLIWPTVDAAIRNKTTGCCTQYGHLRPIDIRIKRYQNLLQKYMCECGIDYPCVKKICTCVDTLDKTIEEERKALRKQ